MNYFYKIYIFMLAACLINYSNAQDFFLKINDWEKSKKINIPESLIKKYKRRIECNHNKENKIYKIIIKSNNGLEIPVIFFDRKSDKIIVTGQPLPAPKEMMLIYSEIFSTYDVILFDYRWNNKYLTSLIKAIFTRCPTKKILLDEIEEINSVLKFVNEHKKYSKIIGLGECYSNFLFAKIQADQTNKYGKGPFTHLIFDSCWYSLRLFAESICSDPFLPISPRTGGAPGFLKKLTNNFVIKKLLLGLIFKFLHDISIEPYLSLLNIPVLFVHGLKDLFVPQSHFEKIWDSTPNKFRAAFFTPYRHCDNLGDKFLYFFIADLFIKSESIKDFQKKFNKISDF